MNAEIVHAPAEEKPRGFEQAMNPLALDELADGKKCKRSVMARCGVVAIAGPERGSLRHFKGMVNHPVAGHP